MQNDDTMETDCLRHPQRHAAALGTRRSSLGEDATDPVTTKETGS